ncbi:MAG: hypothetical protein ACRBHB_23205 [Arenicella sp.]
MKLDKRTDRLYELDRDDIDTRKVKVEAQKALIWISMILCGIFIYEGIHSLITKYQLSKILNETSQISVAQKNAQELRKMVHDLNLENKKINRLLRNEIHKNQAIKQGKIEWSRR